MTNLGVNPDVLYTVLVQKVAHPQTFWHYFQSS